MSEETDNTVDDASAVASMVERPSHVPEKFWDNESKAVRHDDVLKSYNELSSRFGAFTGAPESYEFSLSEDLIARGVSLDADNPLIAQFTEMAKASNMSADMANKLVNMFVEGQYAGSIGAEEAETARISEEMAKLGDNAQQRISNITNWARANLSPEHLAGLEESATTAAGVQAIEALIAKTRNAPMQQSAVGNAGAMSMTELQALQFAKDEHGNRKMQTDPAYRKMVQEKFAQLMPGENIVTVG